MPSDNSALKMSRDSYRNPRSAPGTARKRFKLLVGAGITAAALALTGSIYGVIFLSVPKPSRPAQSSFAFYQTLAEVPGVPTGKFEYGGATAFASLRSPMVMGAIEQAHPSFDVVYTESRQKPLGSGTEIERLLAGEVSFVQSSRPLQSSEIQSAQERGFTLEQIPVALDGIAVYVNPQISIPGLSLSQIRDIFTGKIRNWQDVGGPDLAIKPFTLPSTSGTTAVLAAQVLAGEEFSSIVETVENTTKAVRTVARTPGGISYASAAAVVDQETVKLLPLAGEAGFESPAASVDAATNQAAFSNRSYPLVRKLYVIVRQDGTIDEQAGIAYANLLLSDDGQQLVEQAGFASIR